MTDIPRAQVRENYLTARKWMFDKGFDSDNLFCYSVRDDEMLLVQKVASVFGTPDAPVTEGAYSVWEDAVKMVKDVWIPETVYSGFPNLVYKTRKKGVRQDFSSAEHQSIWVHALMHVYQLSETSMRRNSELLDRMSEIDRTVNYGLKLMEQKYDAQEAWEKQRWRDYVSVLNALAGSGIKEVCEFSEYFPEHVSDMRKWYDLLFEKYELRRNHPLTNIICEGTAMDVQQLFLEENGGSDIMSPSSSGANYYFGFLLSRQVRESDEGAWWSMLEECGTDYEFLERVEDFGIDLGQVVSRVGEEFGGVGEEGEVSFSDALLRGRKFRDFKRFKDYYDKVRDGARVLGDVQSDPLNLLYIDKDFAVLSVKDLYLRDEELSIMSKFISPDGRVCFPDVIALREGGLDYVVGVRQVEVKEFNTPYDLIGEGKSWSLHLPVSDDLEDVSDKLSDEIGVKRFNDLEDSLDSLSEEQRMVVKKAVYWCETDGKED